MDRNVVRIPQRNLGPGTETSEPNAASKLLKYFPGEAIALYSTLSPAVATLPFSEPVRTGCLWGAVVVSVVFCCVYLRRVWHVERGRQIAISAGALVLYIAALGGPFTSIPGFHPSIGLIAAVVASAFLTFVPSPQPQQA